MKSDITIYLVSYGRVIGECQGVCYSPARNIKLSVFVYPDLKCWFFSCSECNFALLVAIYLYVLKNQPSLHQVSG